MEIRLSRCDLVAVVDAEDYDRIVALGPWRRCPGRTTTYAQGPNNEMLHRVILDAPVGLYVDHRDRDGLNNRRSNLRLATPAQNGVNGRARGGSSPYRGVSWDRTRRRWMATIRYGGRKRNLGYFVDEVEAARAYDRSAWEHHGDFATLNFPETS